MAKMSPDEYMEVLVARQQEWLAANPPRVDTIRPQRWVAGPLLEWFVREGDEDLVQFPESGPSA